MGFAEDVRKAADCVGSHGEVTIISHIDADGITSASILAQACARAGCTVQTPIFVRQLEPQTMQCVPRDATLKIFTDLGAGQQNLIEKHGLPADEVLIIDHHVEQPCGTAYQQVNGLPYGHTKLSAAGVAYLVARELDEENRDLAKLAVVGNVGDMMAREGCGLTGPAREIVEDGVEHGSIEVMHRTLNVYGISTRPIHIALAYSDDPHIPGITNNVPGAAAFLERLKCPLKENSSWMVWEEIPADAKRRVMSALVQQMIAHRLPHDRLLGEAYLFPDEPARSPLRNASEFATVLNACGRWDNATLGHTICLGDRSSLTIRDADRMMNRHRSVIRELLDFILEHGVRELSHLQTIHVGSKFPDTVVGIGAGIALSRLNYTKPILIMCTMRDDPGMTKVSMRATERLVSQGIDLQAALTAAAARFSGAAGGHKIAAGAYIPHEAEEPFVTAVNDLLGEQYASARAHHC
jgi:RecJ-like exonuclease